MAPSLPDRLSDDPVRGLADDDLGTSSPTPAWVPPEPIPTAPADETAGASRPIAPFRRDYVYRAIRLVGRDRPFLTGAAYFLISLGSIYLIGFLTGDLFGSAEKGIPPFYLNVPNNISLGFLAPVGAALLCNHYNEIGRTWAYVRKGSVLADPDPAALDALEGRVDAAYNRWLFVIVPLVIAVALNVFNYIIKADTWLGMSGGITAVYARLFITANFFMIGLILYKAMVTAWSLQRILSLPLTVQPLHPDRAGGLKPFGSLSLAIFYFLSLITVYFTLLLLLDETARSNLRYYLPIYLLFYVLAPLLLMLSLGKAHRQMASAKEQVLHRLATTFNKRYRAMLASEHQEELDMATARDIERIHSIYAIVEKMPVWPFDLRNLSRFVTAIVLPGLVLLTQFLIDRAFPGLMP
ncbi:MAG: hypothetical protein JW785_11385 [Acidimicrobiia bacterium]|nr:hypothetical protein [Acidimicrobiia bacterium]